MSYSSQRQPGQSLSRPAPHSLDSSVGAAQISLATPRPQRQSLASTLEEPASKSNAGALDSLRAESSISYDDRRGTLARPLPSSSGPIHSDTYRPSASIQTLATGVKTMQVSTTRRSSASSGSLDSQTDRRGSQQGSLLSLELPNIETIGRHRAAANASGDLVQRVSWAKSLLDYLERTQTSASISDAKVVQWIQEAIGIIQAASTCMPPIAEALYMRADLRMTGMFPSLLPRDPKQGFRDFEAAANCNFARAWYRIGREYEAFTDNARARDAYKKGADLGDSLAAYRLGMAYLLGQITLQPDIRRACDLLSTAALISDRLGDTSTAAPLFVWGTILAGEFGAPGISPTILPRDLKEANRLIRRAAFLGHAAAQHRMGQVYEYAQLGQDFDAVRSLQYYSLASQQGDADSDLALSKWFLCGSEQFAANERLAFTFAEKAASKLLPSGQFAIGYYYELGIGTAKDLVSAKEWYKKARDLGNSDAQDRLRKLETGSQTLSRIEHVKLTDERLTRRHTQAKQRSEARRGKGGERHRSSTSIDQALQVVEEAAQLSSQAQSLPLMSLQRPQASSTMDRSAKKTATTTVLPMHSPIKQSSGPQTFADMGIPATRLQKDDCIVS